jgi:hypothetical protein
MERVCAAVKRKMQENSTRITQIERMFADFEVILNATFVRISRSANIRRIRVIGVLFFELKDVDIAAFVRGELASFRSAGERGADRVI